MSTLADDQAWHDVVWPRLLASLEQNSFATEALTRLRSLAHDVQSLEHTRSFVHDPAIGGSLIAATATLLYARQLYQLQDSRNAASLAEGALLQFETSFNWLGAGVSLWILACLNMAKSRGNADMAQSLSWLSEALKFSHDLKEGMLATVVLTETTQVHLRASAIDKGVDCATRAILQARDCNYTAGEARALELLAELHSRCDRHHDALEARQEALELRQQAGLEVSRKAEAELLLAEARTLAARGEAAQASVGLENALQLCKHDQDLLPLKASAFLLLSRAHVQTNRLSDACLAAEQAHGLYRAAENKIGEAQAVFAFACSLPLDALRRRVHCFTSAADSFRECNQLRQEAEARSALSRAHLDVLRASESSNLERAFGDVAGTLQAAKLAFKIHRRMHDGPGQEEAIRLVAELLETAGVDPGGLVNGGIEERLNILNGMDEEEWLRGLHAAIMDMAKKKQSTKPALRQQQNCNAFMYSVIWEAAQARAPLEDQQKQLLCPVAVSAGLRSHSVQALHGIQHQLADLKPLKPQVKSKPMVLCVVDLQARWAVGSTMMSITQLLSSLIAQKLPCITIVQLGESAPDKRWYGPSERSSGPMGLHPIILALQRTMRIEAPQVEFGTVTVDMSSWRSGREEILRDILSTPVSEECELAYCKGKCYKPSIVAVQSEEYLYSHPAHSVYNH